MSGPWVLMYHRVCDRDATTRCWFERGTAVTPAALDRQLGWLQERFEIVPLEELHAPAPADAPARVALTFDDGYADTLDVAAPICAHRGLAATCFASAGPATGGAALWFDVWYSLIHVGLERADWHVVLRELGIPEAVDLNSCVRGPAKQWLASLDLTERQGLLDRLARALAVVEPCALHLDREGLRRLRRLGWRIGGHGVDHFQLASCDAATMERELRGSRQLLHDVADASAPLFAYPDGSFSDGVVEAVADAGFALACTVRAAPWSDATLCMTVPRLFARGDTPVPHPALADSSARVT